MKFIAEINPQGKIVPLYDSDNDVFRKLKKNTPLSFDVKQPRNYMFHKKTFALITMVFDNQNRYINIDRFREDLTIEAGFYTEHVDMHGEIKKTAKSISFAKMDNLEFEKFYNQFIDTVIRVFKWDNAMIEDNIESYL